MSRTVGVVITDHAAVSLVEDNRLAGPVLRFPDNGDAFQVLRTMPAEELSVNIQQRIEEARGACDVRNLVLPSKEEFPVPPGQCEFVPMPPGVAAKFRS